MSEQRSKRRLDGNEGTGTPDTLQIDFAEV